MSPDLRRLLHEIRSLPPDDQDLVRRALGENDTSESTLPAEGDDVLADEAYQRQLLKAGLIKQIKPRRRDQGAFERFQPIDIAGKPLSETVVEDRR